MHSTRRRESRTTPEQEIQLETSPSQTYPEYTPDHTQGNDESGFAHQTILWKSFWNQSLTASPQKPMNFPNPMSFMFYLKSRQTKPETMTSPNILLCGKDIKAKKHGANALNYRRCAKVGRRLLSQKGKNTSRPRRWPHWTSQKNTLPEKEMGLGFNKVEWKGYLERHNWTWEPCEQLQIDDP